MSKYMHQDHFSAYDAQPPVAGEGASESLSHLRSLPMPPEDAVVWTRQLDVEAPEECRGPRVAVDGYGNTYVTAVTTRGTDDGNGVSVGVLIKYDPDGDAMWTRYLGPAESSRAANAAIDGADNVCVVTWGDVVAGPEVDAGCMGQDLVVKKFDSDGQELWSGSLEFETIMPPAVATGRQDEVCVAGVTEDESFVAKYDADGQVQWTVTIASGPHTIVAVTTVATDAEGNVYVAGVTNDVLPGQTSDWEPGELVGEFTLIPDAFIRQYGPQGEELWTRQLSSRETVYRAPYEDLRISVDPAGNVYMATAALAAPGVDSAVVMIRKFDPTGSVTWSVPSYRQPGQYERRVSATGIAVDSFGGVFVSGASALFSEDVTVASQALLRQYDTDGSELWTHEFGMGELTWLSGVGVDRDGNVYAVGMAVGGWSGGDGPTLFLRKYGHSPGE